MKAFLIILVTALAGVSSGNQVSNSIYPCPHSGTTRLAHSSSCSQFVQCVNGVAVEEHCATGLFFSEVTQQCTTPRNANCSVEQTPCPKWTDPENLVFLTNGQNCNNYFMCFDGQPLSMNCASGLSFSSNSSQCIFGQCSTTLWSCGGNENSVHPDDSDCSRFYHCHKGVQYGGKCPSGKLFDTMTSRCVETRYANCGIFTTVPSWTETTARPTVSCQPTCTTPPFPTQPTTNTTTTPPFPTQPTTNTTTRPWTTTPQTSPGTTNSTTTRHSDSTTTSESPVPISTSTSSSTSTAEPEHKLDSFCKTSEVGLVAVVPHPDRCDWYIQCTFGHASVGKCGAYQIFHPYKGRCVLGYPTICRFFDDENKSIENV